MIYKQIILSFNLYANKKPKIDEEKINAEP